MGARTGKQFLEGLRGRKREIWLGRERIDDVTTHPSLAGGAASMADLYDLQHQYADECLIPDPETGEPINISHMIPRSGDDLRKRRVGLSRIHRHTVGHMGRSPDYNSLCFAGFAGQWRAWTGKDGSNAEGAENLVNYQKFLRRNDISTTHTLMHPAIDKSKENLVAGTEHALHVVGETKDSIVVRGARVLATLAPFADELVVWSAVPLTQPNSEPYALAFGIPMDTPGLIFLCRDSYGSRADVFDQPLSARFDEEDAFAIFDNVEIPKERVFLKGDVELYNSIPHTGFVPNMQQQTTIRALAKLEFAYGLGTLMTETINDTSDSAKEMLGELLCYVELTRTALLNAEDNAFDHGDGVFFPDPRPLEPLRAMMTQWMPRSVEILKLIGSHNLLCYPSRQMLDEPRLRPLIESFLKGVGDIGAERRAAVFRMAWDYVGSGLAGRQDLYERFYIRSGSTNRKALHMMQSMSAPAAALANLDRPERKTTTTRQSALALVEDILSRPRSPHAG